MPENPWGGKATSSNYTNVCQTVRFKVSKYTHVQCCRPAAIPIATGEVMHFDRKLLHLAQTAVHLVHQCQVGPIFCRVKATYRLHSWNLQQVGLEKFNSTWTTTTSGVCPAQRTEQSIRCEKDSVPLCLTAMCICMVQCKYFDRNASSLSPDSQQTHGGTF